MLIGANPVTALGATVGIKLTCYGNPERTAITNNTRHTITIQTVGSTYRPNVTEPFHVNRLLNPGATITYQSGRGATRHVLTRSFIFYNNDERDGVKVRTSIGTFTKHC
jgi:hypothetical protein